MSREASGDFSRLLVWEKDDYSLSLRRSDGAEHGLYGVFITTPFESKKVFVLAEDADGAIDQARCYLKLESYALPPDYPAMEVRAYAERLPLIIRGWSRTVF